jgi:PmbA protein
MTALSKAIEKIGPKRHRGGTFRMVVDRSVSSRLVSPLLSALNGAAIQQKNSFLDGSLGKKIFSERLTITDLATTSGKPGARLFDTEGTATSDRPVIKNGVVSMYFINTYIAEKTGFSPTIEGVSRPVVAPFFPGSMPEGDADSCLSEEFEINLPRILKLCGSGIYVTGFNGGNCNPTTGDFSYGVEGFAFRDGKITHPIREMVVTGNMITLWNGILAAGTDARPCTRWQIPTLAFNAADFSA